MKLETIDDILSWLEAISDVRIRLISDDIEEQFDKWSLEYPSILTSFMFNNFKQLCIPEQLNKGFICHVAYQLGIENLYIPICENTYIIIGPYCSTYLPVTDINHRLEEYNLPPTRTIYNFYANQLPLIPVRKISALKDLLCTSLELTVDKNNVLLLHEPEKELSPFHFIQDAQLDTQTKLLLRHEKTLAFTKAVSEGDYDKCMQIFTDASQYRIEKHYSSNPATNELISMIYNGALFYFAAVNGGVSPGEADKLFAQYVHDLLVETSFDNIHNIGTNMLRAFCDLVLQQKAPVHSGLIQQIINYLSLHTDTELTAEVIAPDFHLSPTRIEKLFKAECGTTISKFHRAMRLKKAATLLADPSLSIHQVAAWTGFLDQNYFSRVFKAAYGVTPSQYRINSTQEQWNATMLFPS